MEYFENFADAVAKLSWSSLTQAKEIIPQTRLYPPLAMPTSVNTVTPISAPTATSTPGILLNERIVGRVWMGNTPQTGYSVASYDEKTATWGTNEGGPYFALGSWLTGSRVTIILNSNPGTICSWEFDSLPNEIGGENSGQGCSAVVTIGSGQYSPDWQNHLQFYIFPL
jgi:hypothetical protein